MANKAKPKKNVAVVKEETTGFSPRQIKKFYDEVKIEFSKIVWPQRKVTLSLTGIVIVLSLIIAAYLGSVDMLLGKIISMFLK
jgi:preprotein translocase subunit SecE